MKNFLQVNRALAAEKNFLQISKLFHDEVMSRASRGQVEGNTCVEHFSHKALMLLFAVLVMSIANIGMAWGASYTWSFAAGGDAINSKTASYTSTSGSKTLTYVGGSSDGYDGTPKYLKMNGNTQYSSYIPSSRYFHFVAPSAAGKITINYAASNAGNARILRGTNRTILLSTITGAVSSACESGNIYGLTAGTTVVTITFEAKAYISSITWTDVDAPTYTSSYYSEAKAACTSGATFATTGGSESTGSGIHADFAKYTSINNGKVATFTFGTPLSLNSNGSNKGCIRVYYGVKACSLSINGGSGTALTTPVANVVNYYEYTIPDGTTNISSIALTNTGSANGCLFYAIEVLTYPAAAGCLNYSFHTGGNDVKTNNTQSCFVQVGSSHEWQLTDYTIPADTKFFVGDRGWWYDDNLGTNNSRSSAQTWASEMYLARSFDSGDATGSPKLGQATGATGTIRIYDNSNWNNLNAAFIPDGYVLKVGSNEHAFAFLSSNEYRTDIVEINSTTYDDAISVGVKNSSNGYVATANSQELRHIFFVPSPQWKSSNAKFCIHYWGAGDSRIGFMSEVPGKSGWYEGWLPSGATGFQFERQDPAGSVPSEGNRWTAGDNQTLQDGKNCYTMTATGDSWDKTITTSLYSASGKYRMFDNSKSINWYVTFVPYYVLRYNANGGSNVPAQQSIETTASPCQLTVAAGSGMTAPTGYQFLGWNPNESQADAGTKDGNYDPGDTPTMSEDVTLYAVWSAKEYTITLDDEGATSSVSPSSVTATYNSSTIASITNPGKTGYTFGGWYSGDDGTGTLIIDTNGNLQANTAYTGAGGIWTNDGGVTLHAKWTETQYAVTHSLTHVTATSGATGANAATYNTNYNAVFAPSTSDYRLPEDITVNIGGVDAVEDEAYTWNSSTGALTITGSYILGEINIAITACEKPAAPVGLGVESKTHNSATLRWDEVGAGPNGYKIALVSASGAGTFDWKDRAEAIYIAEGLTPSTAYTFKVKYKGTGSQCEFSDEVTVDFTTNAASTYTVTFNSNGGSAVSPITQASAGASIAMPAAPTYASHTFQGWVIGGETFDPSDSYTPEANVTAYATWKANCAGGGGSGATLFTQNFNSATEVAYEDRASSKLSITTSSGNNIVGNTAASQFTSITADKKGTTGIAINSASGGNSQSASGIFQAYYNNTGGYWSICKTSDFAATAPTAIKVGMKVWAKVGSSSSAVMANFAVGDGFSDGLTSSSPSTSSVHSGFSITNESSMKFAAYNVYNTKIYNTALTQSSWMTLTWVINNTGDDLEYDNPNSGKTTVNDDCYDLWLGTTLVAHNIAATTAAKDLQNLYIGSPSGKNHEIRLDDISVVDLSPAGGGCYYVTYDGNGAETGSISDATAYTSGDEVTVSNNTGGSAFTKTGYRFNGWNTAANGSGMAYAAGATFNISENVTLHAQWVLDACSAPAAPTISGTASRTVGETITLTATCASGADGSTTYTWYKGVDWATASAASPVQAAMTAGAGGRTFTKASCVAGDAGKYWCEASNGTGCEANNETGFTVTVSAAVEEHIYYYKDANHYSEGTYSNPEGNTAVKKDNQSLSSPWMICNGCKAGVDSVVAHGATYDGKGNHMNAYIKLPTGGNATTKNIKFALTAGYTGTLRMKIGGYENNPTVTLQPLNTSTGVLGDAISYSGTVSGVATTENNFGEITWNLSTAGGTYVLTVTSKTGYISQIDMTTATTATFRVTYNGNGSTGGDVPTDDTDYDADASVTVQAQGTMEKANYTFGGWNTANNGTGTNYVAGSGTFSIKGATTLYAHWTQSIYLAPGAKGSGTNGATVSWNGTAVRGFTAHTAAGYSLTGYYTETSGGTKVLNADGSFAATNVTDYITDGKWSRTGAAATLYAQWSGSAIVTNTLNVGSKTWGSSITTTAPLQITNLSALAGQGGINVGEATDEQAAAGTPGSGKGKGSLSPKVEAGSGESKTAEEYMQLSFTVASGYQLRVTGLSAIVRSVSNDGKYDAVLSDGEHSIEVTGVNVAESLGSGANLFASSYNTTFTGNVTLRIWGYSSMSAYRYATPIAIYGAVEETCTPPTFSGLDYSATEYTQGDLASAISVTGAANVGSYHWKYNTVNDRTSGTECGTGASVTPATDASATTDGTRYYWCELTNGCTTVKTSTVAVTVRASASDPTVTWSNVKLGATDNVTPNYGGGNYTLRATVDQSTWSGTLVSSMITAPAGITIHDVTTGTAEGKRYIEFKFDVTTAFDREENETIGFHLSLPAISGTPNWNALTSDKQVAYEACDEGSGVAGQVAIPLTATAQTSASNPQNYWEVAEAGWLAFNYGSAVSVLPAATAYRTSEVDFGYYVATTNKKKWMFQPYIAGVNKVRVAFRAAGNLSSGQASVSKFYYDTEYFSSPGSHENLIGDVSANQATYTSGENGYIEFTVPEMAANSYGAFELANSSIEIYGIVLYSENTGSGGTIETDPTWSGGLNKDGSSVVERAQGAANFTYTISTTTNTLGGITYSSSDPSVAEVNATTGEVRITATGNTVQTAVITATLARSGCYQPATRTYTVRVAGSVCPDPIGTIEAEDLGCSGTRMTFSGYADGANIKWYRNGSEIPSATSAEYTATAAGSYYAVATLGCDRQSNTIVVTAAEVDADRVVEKWYIKNGRLTPDIKLWTLDEGSHLVSVAWSPSNVTGLNLEGDIYESDGAVYLTGRAPGSNDTGADIEYTLTLTINNGCAGETILSDASKKITIIHQKNTDKHVLAFVVTGKEKGGFTESIPASQTTSVDLYNEIAKNFDVLATNIYATDDEQKIKEYYSQFDIICITDYPNTKTKGAHSKSYSDAIGVMVDIRPVLTMEAWVSGLSNWNKKGISGDPKSPSTRQYSMLLQCKDHEVFSGTTLTEVGEGDDKMYRIHMVDETLHPYDTLDANYGSGTHESKKGYRYGSYPALQGFTFSQAMEDADLLPLGLIDDGAGKDLQVGLERQHEMSARMMVLGINSTAMERLTDDGERIVINALKYLMKKNAEEIADCSTSFVGGAEGDGENWMNADNWTGNTVPDKTQKVRILAPCVIPTGERAHVAGVLIAPNDGGTYNGGSTPTTGSLTIAAGGALVVDGKIQAVTAPAFNRPRATSAGDLAVLTDDDAQGALIFDNSEGETQATVQMYSPSYWEYKEGTNKKKSYWSYVAVPIQDAYVGEFFYGAVTYLYDETSGWIRKKIGTHLHAFEGIGLSLPEGHTETFYGPLAPTEDRTVTLTKTTSGGNGENLIGNSWTAPIQIANFEASDFGSATQSVMIYSTGRDGTQDDVRENAVYVTATVENDGNVSAGQWVSIPINVPSLDGYDGLKVIPAMQAFQVNTSSETSLTLNYDKLVRDVNIVSDNLTEKQHAPARRFAGAKKSLMSTMRVRVSGVKTRTDVWLLEDDRFSDEFDNGWEATYAECDDRSAQFYAQSEIGNMSFMAKPDIEGTVLGFAPSKDGNQYLFTFHYVGDEEYYLNDLKLTSSTLISNESSYLFTYEAGDTNRFYISRQPLGGPAITTGVDEVREEAKPRKFIYNDKMYILFNGRVFDATGKAVK